MNEAIIKSISKISAALKSLIFFFILLQSSVAQSTEVVLIAPENSIYWSSVYDSMKPVAEQLGLKLIVLRPSKSFSVNFALPLKKYLETNKKPDWVIWAPRSNSPIEMLNLLESHQIYSINISNPIVENEVVGQPMDIYKYWKAEISSSNFIGTYEMMTLLVKQGYDSNLTPPYSLIAIGGNQRLKSAQKVTSSVITAAGEIRNLNLLQIVHTDWSRKSSLDKTLTLLKRYHKPKKKGGPKISDDVNFIWAGNIDLALGVVDAVKQFTSIYKNAVRPLVVSQGWHSDIFEQIEKNNIEMSIGGNHLNGIWALILIYDHINGIQLEQQSIDKILVVDKLIVSKTNIGSIRKLLDNDFWQTVNIKKYSKTDNKLIHRYQFNVEDLITKH